MFSHTVFVFVIFSIVHSNCDKLYESCGNNNDCVEKAMVRFVDEFEGKRSLNVFGDYVTLEKNGDYFEAPRSVEGLIDRCVRYLANHELKIKLPSEISRVLLEESRSSKLKKIVLPLLILFKLKAAIVVTIVLSVIALISFKGLGASLVALAISGATGFKSLLENHSTNSKVSYEIIPPSHWSRVGGDPLTQGYHTMS